MFIKTTALVALLGGASAWRGGDCHNATSKSSCDRVAACTWCVSAAVPSSCKTVAEAKSLPPAVFVCDKTKAPEERDQFLNLRTTARDLPTCISDLEAMIPDAEKIIADIKAGNYPQALADGMALLPEAEKAFTDCTSQEINLSEVFEEIGRFNLENFGAKYFNIDMESVSTCAGDILEMVPEAKMMAPLVIQGKPQVAIEQMPWAKAFKTIADCKNMVQKVSDEMLIIM